MADLKLRAKSEGLDRIEREFDGLTTAQQRAILKTSAVGKQFENMEKKAVGAIKRSEAAANGGQVTMAKLGDSVQGLVGNFTAVGAAGGLAFKGVSALIKQAQEDAENLRRVLKESTDASALKGSSSGAILLNAGDLAQDIPEANRVISKLDKVALERGRSGAELGNTFAEIRPGTGGATDDQRIQALELGFKAKQLDERFDASGFATAIIKIAQSNERRGEAFDLNKASDQYFAIGDVAGLDTNELGQPLSGLIGAETTGASIQQLGGALAFYTAKTKKTGESGVEAILPLITKLATEEKIKIAGKNVTLAGDDPFAKLTDFTERLNKGEFGDNKTRAIADLTKGGGGVNTQLLVGQISSDLTGFKGSLSAALTSKGGGIEDRFNAQRQLSPTFDEKERANQAAARTFAANANDITSATSELRAQQMDDLLRQFGEDPTKPGGAVNQFLYDYNPWAKNRGDTFRSEFAAGADPADLRRELLQSFFTENGIQDKSALGGSEVQQSRAASVGRAALAAGDERGAAFGYIAAGAVNKEDGLSRLEQGILNLAGASSDMVRYLQLKESDQAAVSAELQAKYAAEYTAILTASREFAAQNDAVAGVYSTAKTSASAPAQEVR